MNKLYLIYNYIFNKNIYSSNQYTFTPIILVQFLFVVERTSKQLTWQEMMAVTQDAWDISSNMIINDPNTANNGRSSADGFCESNNSFWTNYTLRAELVQASIGFEDVFPVDLKGTVVLYRLFSTLQCNNYCLL